MSDPSVERVIVTVNEQHLPTIQSVAKALQAAGMNVTNVMPTTGIITGEVSPAHRQHCKAIPGVADVESDGEMHAI